MNPRLWWRWSRKADVVIFILTYEKKSQCAESRTDLSQTYLIYFQWINTKKINGWGKGSRIASRLSPHLWFLLRVSPLKVVNGQKGKGRTSPLPLYRPVVGIFFLLDCCVVYLQIVYQENVHLWNETLSRVNDKIAERVHRLKTRYNWSGKRSSRITSH